MRRKFSEHENFRNPFFHGFMRFGYPEQDMIIFGKFFSVYESVRK